MIQQLERDTKVALLFGRAPPWLMANFNAAAQRMGLVVVETNPLGQGREADAMSDHVFRRITVPSNGDSSISLIDRIGRTLDELRPDVVVTLGWAGERNLGALQWCVRNRIPGVVATDSTAQDHVRIWWNEAVKRRVLRGFSAAWAAGKRATSYLVSLGMPPERIVRGPVDTIDTAHFAAGADEARRQGSQLRRQLGLPENYFLAASRFAPEKNIRGLLRAFAHYRGKAGYKAWRLVLVGGGPLDLDVRRWILELGLTEAVILPGFVKFEELPKYYGLARAFIHASTRDTWAVVVNEAMAAELPVLVSHHCGCVPDLVREGQNGFSFDPLDTENLAQLMLRIVHGDCDLAAMGRRSRRIIKSWSPEHYADSLARVVTLARATPIRPVSTLDRALLGLLARSR